MVVSPSTAASRPATRTVTATEARVHLGDMIRTVTERGEDVVVEKSGRPEIVMISVEDYDEFRRLRPKATTRTTGDWGDRFLALRAEILAEMGDKELGDVDELIDYGQR